MDQKQKTGTEIVITRMEMIKGGKKASMILDTKEKHLTSFT